MNHYLGKYHIYYTCSRISSNVFVISKRRYYLSISQLKQLYYNLIYPHLSYAIIAWGSAYKTHLKRLQSKQNTVLRLMFFATTSGPYTESALPSLNLLDVLTVNNVYRLHLWHKGHPRTNTGKQMFSYQAIILCRGIPH